jgi:hypothetical protein
MNWGRSQGEKEGNAVERVNELGMKDKGRDSKGATLWPNAAGLYGGVSAQARPSADKPQGGHPVPRTALPFSPSERLRRSVLGFGELHG